MFSGLTNEEVYAKCFELIKAENDRGAALLAAVFAEAALDSLISERLIPQNGKNKLSINSFSMKINLAVRVGIIPENVSKLLHGLREIRNVFAHQIISDFDTPNVATETEKIFQFLPEHYARFIDEWSAGINKTFEEYQIDQKVSAGTLKLRVRFNNYFAQIIMDLNAIQKTNKRLETIY